MEKIKLFVVDDDPICREDMVKSLEKISPVYGVGSAKDGREAIEKSPH